jgi:acyl-coenzyme A synthetase/AMP-(fatty) acid ligase
VKFWADTNPDGIAVIDERMSLSYKDLRNFVGAAATVLEKKGVKRGDLVCITLPSLYGFVFQIVLHSMGVTVVSKNDLKAFPSTLSPNFLLTNKLNPNFDVLKTMLINQDFFDEVAASEFSRNLHGFDDEELVTNLFGTSGSTGESKYLETTLRIFSERINEPAAEDLFGEGLQLFLLPFGGMWSSQHAFRRLKFGKTYVTFYGDDTLSHKLFEKIVIETIVGSPAQVSNLLDLAEKKKIDLNSIKSVVVGGDVILPQLITRIRTQIPGCKIRNIYGSTEVGGIAHEDITSEVRNELILRPWVDVEIVDRAGKVLLPNTEGLVRTKSPIMGSKFYNDEIATSESFQFGFHYPGDVGKITTSGRLVLLGRSDNVLHLNGIKVSAEQIEAELRRVSGHAAVIAFEVLNQDSDLTHLGLAFETGDGLEESAVTKWLQEVGLGKIHVFLNVSFPLTTTGKVSRNEMAAILRAQKPDFTIVT